MKKGRQKSERIWGFVAWRGWEGWKSLKMSSGHIIILENLIHKEEIKNE